MTAMLELDRIDTFYGPVQAHFGLSLSVGAGRIVCLLARASTACPRIASCASESAPCPKRVDCSR
jgi:hypothetical protein